MRRISQRNPKWTYEYIGKSKTTIGEAGCLITALCMIHSKFYPMSGSYLNPDDAAKTWKFVKIPGDKDPRFLDWVGTNFDGMDFVHRNWGYNPETDNNRIKEYCNDPDMGVVLQVQTKYGQHWVACVGRSILGWASNDPIDGRRLWKTAGWGAPYRRITGWAVMAKL